MKENVMNSIICIVVHLMVVFYVMRGSPSFDLCWQTT